MPFVCPPEHQFALNQVKSAVGLPHDLLDNWVYLFLANKRYDVNETVAKLRRRDAMERETFAGLDIVPSMCRSIHSGVIQYVGRDKEGRPVLYFNTARDRPTAQERPERRVHFDIFMSWAVRCDAANPTSTVTWLINQDGASLLRNIDIIFQKDMALRTSKFFPGMVARMYICNMNSTLTFVLKSLVAQLPQAIRQCIHFFSPKDVRAGRLRDFIDAAVLPVVMGGENADCDQPSNYARLAHTMTRYLTRCVDAVAAGLTVKQMEMMEAYGVDSKGQPMQTNATPCAMANASLQPAVTTAINDAAACEEEGDAAAVAVTRLPAGMLVERSNSRIRNQCHEPDEATGMLVTCYSPVELCPTLEDATSREPPMGQTQSRELGAPLTMALTASSGVPLPRLDEVEHSTLHILLSPQPSPTPSLPLFTRCASSPRVHRDAVEAAARRVTEAQRNAWLRDWVRLRCHCVDLAPLLRRLLVRWRQARWASAAEDMSVTTVNARDVRSGWSVQDVSCLQCALPRILRVAQSLLELCPPSDQRLTAALLTWLTASAPKVAAMEVPHKADGQLTRLPSTAVDAVTLTQLSLDCTSATSFLLSVQACALIIVESSEQQAELDGVAARVLREALHHWPCDTARYVPAEEAITHARAAATHSWEQLVPLLQNYLECKVTLAIADFMAHYRLLIEHGKIDTNAEWYHNLFSGVVRFRELHRQRWVFHVFPPLFRGMALQDGAPSMSELLRVACATGVVAEAGGDGTPLSSLSTFIAATLYSLRATRKQLAAAADLGGSTIPSRGIVESYLEHSQARLSIPYESQRSGVTPAELTRQVCTRACDCLASAQPLLETFVFLQAALFVLEQVTQTGKLEVAAARVRLHRMRDVCLERIAHHQQTQQVGRAVAALTSKMQDTFVHDMDAFPDVLDAGDPHGYALAYELLILAALLSSGPEKAMVPREEATHKKTPSSATQRNVANSLEGASTVKANDDVGQFCAVLGHVDMWAAPLVQAKQHLCKSA